MIESYKLPQGKIIIGISTKEYSAGTLELEPKQELSKHNRPTVEDLLQIHGESKVTLYKKDNVDKIEKEVILKEGDSFTIPEDAYHIHSNPSGSKSITFWKFDGDISEVIQGIRDKYK